MAEATKSESYGDISRSFKWLSRNHRVQDSRTLAILNSLISQLPPSSLDPADTPHAVITVDDCYIFLRLHANPHEQQVVFKEMGTWWFIGSIFIMLLATIIAAYYVREFLTAVMGFWRWLWDKARKAKQKLSSD